MGDISSYGLWGLIVLVLESLKNGKLPPTLIIKALISKVQSTLFTALSHPVTTYYHPPYILGTWVRYRRGVNLC